MTPKVVVFKPLPGTEQPSVKRIEHLEPLKVQPLIRDVRRNEVLPFVLWLRLNAGAIPCRRRTLPTVWSETGGRPGLAEPLPAPWP